MWFGQCVNKPPQNNLKITCFFGSNVDYLLYLRGAFLGNTQRFDCKTLSINTKPKNFIKTILL